jgi:hypothetical protein
MIAKVILSIVTCTSAICYIPFKDLHWWGTCPQEHEEGVVPYIPKSRRKELFPDTFQSRFMLTLQKVFLL